jgi:hypothetical protein
VNRRPIPLVVTALLAGGFLARVAVRVAAGGTSGGGYDVYREMAAHVARGQGLCPNTYECALRLPLYPLFVAPFVAAGAEGLPLAVAQALIGCVTIGLTWRLAADLFGPRAALAAGFMAAVSPYAVVHDTAFQDTVLVNALFLASLVCLARWHRTDTARTGIGGGLLLGLAVLTTARIGALAAACAIWAVAEHRHGGRDRMRAIAWVVLPLMLVAGTWAARNWRVVGAPVLTTTSGASLWFANSPWTFQYFPDRSIDLAAHDALASLHDPEHAAFWSTASDPVASDRYLRMLGWRYIAAHPARTALGAARKMWVVLSARLSPSHGGRVDAAYRIVYLLINVLAAIGMWRAGWADARHRLIAAVLAAFLLTTAVYWAHTSHKSVLDALLFVYASAALAGVRSPATRPDPAGVQ